MAMTEVRRTYREISRDRKAEDDAAKKLIDSTKRGAYGFEDPDDAGMSTVYKLLNRLGGNGNGKVERDVFVEHVEGKPRSYFWRSGRNDAVDDFRKKRKKKESFSLDAESSYEQASPDSVTTEREAIASLTVEAMTEYVEAAQLPEWFVKVYRALVENEGNTKAAWELAGTWGHDVNEPTFRQQAKRVRDFLRDRREQIVGTDDDK